MYEVQEEGLSPGTAAALLAVVALLGIGLFVVAASIDHKSSDPLYDPINREMHTSSQVQVTPDLWKRKGESAADATTPQQPSASPAPAAPAIPIKIKRDSDQQQQQPAQKAEQPPSTGPS